MADLSFPLAPQHIALQEYRDTIDETERRVERLTEQLRQHTPAWRWGAAGIAAALMEQERLQAMLGLCAEADGVFAGANEIAQGLIVVGRDIDRGELTGAMEPGERVAVTPVGLDPGRPWGMRCRPCAACRS